MAKQLKTCFLNAKPGTLYLEDIEKCVQFYRGVQVKLQKFTWTIGSFEDIEFKNDPEMLESWQERYFNDHMMMQVLGSVKIGHNSEQIILMVCEDTKVYAYDDTTDGLLHLVADNLKCLFNKDISFPGKIVIEIGDCFDILTAADIKNAKKSNVCKKATKEHHKLIESLIPQFKASMAIFRDNKNKVKI